MFCYILIKNNFLLKEVLSFIGFILFIIFLFLIKKYYLKLFEIVIILSFSFMGILFVEVIKANMKENLFSHYSLTMMLPFQLFLNMILLSRASWIYSWIIYIVNILYLMIRVFDFNDSSIQQILMVSILTIINFGFIAHKQEKTYRAYFKLFIDSNEKLKHFKEVLQSFLPSPLLIVNYKENRMEFHNKRAKKIFLKFSNLQKVSFKRKKNLKRNSLYEEKEEDIKSLQNFESILDKHFIRIQENSHILADSKLPLSTVLRNFFENKNKGLEINDNNDEVLSINISIPIDGNDSNTSLNDEFAFSKLKYFEMKATKILWEKNTCLLLVLQDQTKAKRLAELVEIDKYKDQMLASVSHDLRTPLNGMIGMITTVFSTITDKKSKKCLLIAIRSANLLNFLINDILDFSQIIAKKLRLNNEKIKISVLISEIFDLFKIQAKKKRLAFNYEIKSDNRDYIYSDPTRIKQILLNLVGNALKFTMNGFISLEVQNLGETRDSCVFKFSVKDSGIGILEEDQKKLFILFGRLNQKDNDINKTELV